MTRPTKAPTSPGQSHPARQPRDQLEEADRLRQQGKLDRAEAICYPLVRRYPNYTAALHTLGLVYLDKRNHERALDCLVRAAMLDPKNWMTLTALSLNYLRLGANEMAAQTLERALAIRPMDASIFASLGEIHRNEREYETAQQAYRQALTLDPNLESAAIGLALCLSALGQSSEAANVLKRAFALGHRSLNLLHAMATLPLNLAGIDVLGALDRLALSRNEPDAEFKNTLAFARAAALDRAGRHAETWQTLVAANRPLAAEYQAELKADIARRERALAWIRSASPKAIQPSESSEQPISLFILGPSRSGKTSLERLVTSLDGVKAGCEVPIVENAVRRTFQAAAIPTTSYLEELPPALLQSFRDNYLMDLARRAGPAQIFTNTLPGRIYDAGILAMVIPNVRFLLVKRNLDDVAWRIYMSKYVHGNSYAYDLKSIHDYLNWYNLMIDLIVEKFPRIAQVVTYDTIIDDPAATLREVAELCGLQVNDAPVPALDNDRGCAAGYRELMGHA
jgi:Flp pilus assembly protein TadD